MCTLYSRGLTSRKIKDIIGKNERDKGDEEESHKVMMMKMRKEKKLKTAGVNRRQQGSRSNWKCKLTLEAISQVRVKPTCAKDYLNVKK